MPKQGKQGKSIWRLIAPETPSPPEVTPKDGGKESRKLEPFWYPLVAEVNCSVKKSAESAFCNHCLSCLNQAGRGMKEFRTHPDAAGRTNAADNYLIGEWFSWVVKGAPISPRRVLTRRDIVCIFADDAGYHESVLRAVDKGFKVWGFGNGEKVRDKNRGRKDSEEKAKSRLQEFRKAFGKNFYDLRHDPRTWNFAP